MHGVASHVWQEYVYRKARNRETAVDLDELTNVPQATVSSRDIVDESRVRRLRSCWEALQPDQRVLLLRYECGPGKNMERRAEMAAQLGVSIDVLRLRVSRLKRKLERCVGDGSLD